MRVTTQMVNESARRAGIPLNQSSLLNYIDMGGNNDNSLLAALNQKKQTTAAVDTAGKKNYEKVEKEAEELAEAAEAFLQEGENNLFAQAKASGNNQKVYDSIQNFFESYNSTWKALKNVSGTIEDFYRQMMSEATGDIKENLANIGITFDKEGNAVVDMEKVQAADLETLENLFGSKSSFMTQMNFLSARIADSAKANLDSLSSAYNANGNLYSGSIGSKYDFFG